MLARLWFVVSLAWAALFFWNYSTREHPSPLNGLDWLVALLPFISGVVLRLTYRYVRFGPRRRY